MTHRGLKPVADKLKLTVKTADGIGRTAVANASGPLANEKFLTALFGDDAVQKKRNTEAVEFGPSQMVSGRVVSYAPARTQPLTEVRAAVREKLVASLAADLARKEGEAQLAAWKADPAKAASVPAIVVSRDQPQGVAVKVLEAALHADPLKLPAQAGVDLGADGYAVVNVKGIVSRTAPNGDAAKQAQQQYAQIWAAAENQAYYEMLKERYKARILIAQPAAIVATP